MKRESILNNIINSKGYEIALFTSYNFDIDFFENQILITLINNNIKIISLFIDANNLVESLNKITNSYIERRYRVTSIRIAKSFHPKLVLLLGEKKAKLIVSSANLTYSGYYQNNEVFNVFEIDSNNREYTNIINDAIHYFDHLANDFNSFDKSIFNKIKNYEYYNGYNNNSNVRFISNYNEAIMNQIKKIINQANSIDIAVPFYDNHLDALKKIKTLYPQANVNLFIQNILSTFNFEHNKKQKIISQESLFVFDGFKEIGTNKNYHGKVFRFNLDNSSYILYGSSNCTNAALFEDAKTGNHECDILVKGELKEFDYFFDNFIKVDKNAIITNRFIENRNKKNYNFFYILSDNKHELKFQYKNKYDDLKVLLNDNDNEVVFHYMEDHLIIPTDELNVEGIFKVTFRYNNEFEILSCYQLNTDLIEFRNSLKNDINISYDKLIDNKDDSFCKYYTMLLKLVPYNSEDLLDYKKTNQLYNDAQTENDYSNSNEDSFVVDFDIPTEILNKQRQYVIVEDLKSHIIKRFVSRIKDGIIKRSKDDGSNTNFNPDSSSSKKEEKKRPPRSNEAKFSSTITKLFNSILNSKYLNLDENNSDIIKQYIDNILLLLNVIFTYNEDHNSNTFHIEQYINNILGFIDSLIHINLDHINDEIIEFIKILLFVPIIYHCVSKKELEEGSISKIENNIANYKKDLVKEQNTLNKVEVNIRRIVLNYDKKFNLKNNYNEYLIQAYNIVPVVIDYDIVSKYVAQILDYLDDSEIDDFIKSNLGNSTNITKENNMCIIKFHTYDIKKYMNVASIEYLLKQMRNSYKQIEKISHVDLYVYNDNMEIKAINPLEYIEYQYDVKNNLLEKYYKNMKDEDKRIMSKEKLY